MKKIKSALAWLLFHIGHIYNKFPDCLFSYTIYNWCMTKSWLLDDGVVWELPSKEKG